MMKYFNVTIPSDTRSGRMLNIFFVQVKKAIWGRTNSQTCRGNQSAIPETCKADATEWSGDKCNGKTDCEISTNYIEAALEDPCPGVAKYIKVEWTCKDY